MPSAQDFLARLLTPGRAARDGQAEALEEVASGPGLGDEPATRPQGRRQRRGHAPGRLVEEALSQKLLHGWLQSRHETLLPIRLNLHALDPAEREMILHVMAAAAEADGALDESERARIERALHAIGAEEAERRLLPRVLEQPRALAPLLRDVQAARLGAHAYAASRLALDPRSPVNRAYLEYLVARLRLPAQVVNSLNRRYRG